MVMRETIRLGQSGALLLPQRLREAFALDEGSLLIAERRHDGILLRPARVPPDPEVYEDRRTTELLLNNATDQEDYQRVCEEVRRMGLDPAAVPHDRPAA